MDDSTLDAYVRDLTKSDDPKVHQAAYQAMMEAEFKRIVEEGGEAPHLIPANENISALSLKIVKEARELEEQRAEERTQERHVYFNIAEKWAEKPGLAPAEAAHGVAHDLYAKFGHTGKLDFSITKNFEETLGGPDLAADYGRLYDNIKASSIQAKLMRSAADLFD